MQRSIVPPSRNQHASYAIFLPGAYPLPVVSSASTTVTTQQTEAMLPPQQTTPPQQPTTMVRAPPMTVHVPQRVMVPQQFSLVDDLNDETFHCWECYEHLVGADKSR